MLYYVYETLMHNETLRRKERRKTRPLVELPTNSMEKNGLSAMNGKRGWSI